MLSLIGTMHFAGIVVGSALAGVLADWLVENKNTKYIFEFKARLMHSISLFLSTFCSRSLNTGHLVTHIHPDAHRYGRKNLFVISILFMSLTGIGQAISDSYLCFAIFAFLNAVGTAGVFPLAFIIGMSFNR